MVTENPYAQTSHLFLQELPHGTHRLRIRVLDWEEIFTGGTGEEESYKFCFQNNKRFIIIIKELREMCKSKGLDYSALSLAHFKNDMVDLITSNPHATAPSVANQCTTSAP
jgi:hypothetical protein